MQKMSQCNFFFLVKIINLLKSKSKAQQNWNYRKLENAILRAYPKIHVDETVKPSYKRKGPLRWIISHLADRRRKQFSRDESKVLVCHSTSIDDAYRLLQVDLSLSLSLSL